MLLVQSLQNVSSSTEDSPERASQLAVGKFQKRLKQSAEQESKIALNAIRSMYKLKYTHCHKAYNLLNTISLSTMRKISTLMFLLTWNDALL